MIKTGPKCEWNQLQEKHFTSVRGCYLWGWMHFWHSAVKANLYKHIFTYDSGLKTLPCERQKASAHQLRRSSWYPITSLSGYKGSAIRELWEWGMSGIGGKASVWVKGGYSKTIWTCQVNNKWLISDCAWAVASKVRMIVFRHHLRWPILGTLGGDSEENISNLFGKCPLGLNWTNRST